MRGVTFSKRLRQAAADLYQEELAAGNSCLIVDDEIHFTLWYQTDDSGQTAAPQADIPNQNTVQNFMQRFAAAKRITLSQPTSSSDKPSWQRQSANTAQSTTASMTMLKQSREPDGATAMQSENSQVPQFKIYQQLPLTAAAKPLETVSKWNPSQTFSPFRPDPLSSPYLGPLFIPTPLAYCIPPTQNSIRLMSA